MSIIAHQILTVKSPAFADNDFIPTKYTSVGYNINPGLIVKDIPEEARSLALIMEDPDSAGGAFDHWLMWDIPLKSIIEENSAPGVQGRNGKNENKYTGPCPPSGVHYYYFRIYALDTKLYLPVGTDKKMLLHMMADHIIGSGEIMGVYKK